MSPHIPIEHDSPEWHALRSRHIGGSEIAALFDLPPDQVPAYMMRRFALWHVKAGNAPPPHVDSARPKWGLRLENVIADAAAEMHGWEIERGGYVSDPTTAGLGCTLDFIISSDLEESGPGALECKNTDWLIHKRSWTDDEPPAHILLQLQHQLAATGYTWGVVAALVGGNELKVYRYKARPRIIGEIRRRVTAFWASIDAGQEPPVDGSESASAVLAALFPDLADDTADMSMSNEWAEAAHGLFNAAAARRAANDAYDEAKNRIVALLGPHRRGFGNGWVVNCAVSPANPGREPKPGELIGKRAETRRYTSKEMAA